ncbi:MAG: hypothetical protein HRT88_03190 [Lentisphaeraceae bacterium]|nr:hypothetical protein [Lentisphaeraceae bacterium]
MKTIFKSTSAILLLSLFTISCSSHKHTEKCAIGFAPAKCFTCDPANTEKCACLDGFKTSAGNDLSNKKKK